MSLWIWCIAWTAANAIIWFLSRTLSSWSSTYFHLFYSTLCANFWWFLKATQLHHVAIYISSWKFICWTLVWISNSLILSGSRVWIISTIDHRLIVFICSGSYISVTLTQRTNCTKPFSFSFILICHKLSSITTIQHCCSVLISNCILSCL